MPTMQAMTWVGRHVIAVAIVFAAVAATAAVFAFARPAFRPYVMPPPPGGLPYTKVTYTAADARRAFAAAGIALVRNTNGPLPAHAAPIVDFNTKDLVVEVDAFGDPARVTASGFSDFTTFSNGRWVRTPPTCATGATNAERWLGNIRAIVSCTRAGGSAASVLRRVSLALARL